MHCTWPQSIYGQQKKVVRGTARMDTLISSLAGRVMRHWSPPLARKVQINYSLADNAVAIVDSHYKSMKNLNKEHKMWDQMHLPDKHLAYEVNCWIVNFERGQKNLDAFNTNEIL